MESGRGSTAVSRVVVPRVFWEHAIQAIKQLNLLGIIV